MLATVSVCNRAGAAREVTVRGRAYLAAPVTMISPGVLCGSRGCLRYEARDIAASAPAWHRRPITVGHPTVNGAPVGYDRSGVVPVGRVLRPGTDRAGRLKGEAWLDVLNLRAQAPAILDAIRRGEVWECSTGLFLDVEPAPAGAALGGKAYVGTARNYRPDHLALMLPGQKGACSREDGCGVGIVNVSCSCVKCRKGASMARVRNEDGVDIPALAKFFGVQNDPATDPAGYLQGIKDALQGALDKLSTGGEAPPEPDMGNEPVAMAAYNLAQDMRWGARVTRQDDSENVLPPRSWEDTILANASPALVKMYHPKRGA